MIKMTSETVERVLERIIKDYTSVIGRGDGKSMCHTIDIYALYEALRCVRQCNAMENDNEDITCIKSEAYKRGWDDAVNHVMDLLKGGEENG